MNRRFLPQFNSYIHGAAWTTALNGIARLSGFMVSMVIASSFGTAETTGLYFYCIGTVITASLFLGMINAAVLIPESMRLAIQENERARIEFLSFFFYAYLAIGTILTATILTDPVFFFSLISQFETSLLERHHTIIVISTCVLPFAILSSFLAEILNSYRFFTVPALTNVLTSLAILVFILLLRHRFGILSVAMGMLGAHAAQTAWMLFLLRQKLGWIPSLRCRRPSSKTWHDIGYAQAGNAMTSIAGYLPLFLLSKFSGATIAALTFAQSIATIPNNVFTDQILSVTEIKMNSLLSSEKRKQANNIFQQVTKFLIFILTPIAVILFFYTKETIEIIYGRGEFDSSAVNASAQFLKYLALLAPLLCINAMTAKLFRGARKIREAVKYQIVINICIMAGVAAGVYWLGPYGYPKALFIINAVNIIGCYIITKTHFPYIDIKNIIIYLVKIISINMIIIIPIYKTFSCGQKNIYLSFFAPASLYIIILFILCLFTDINTEITTALRTLLSSKKEKTKP